MDITKITEQMKSRKCLLSPSIETELSKMQEIDRLAEPKGYIDTIQAFSVLLG